MVDVGSGGSLTISRCARINEMTATVRPEFSEEGVEGDAGEGPTLICGELNAASTRTRAQK